MRAARYGLLPCRRVQLTGARQVVSPALARHCGCAEPFGLRLMSCDMAGEHCQPAAAAAAKPAALAAATSSPGSGSHTSVRASRYCEAEPRMPTRRKERLGQGDAQVRVTPLPVLPIPTSRPVLVVNHTASTNAPEATLASVMYSPGASVSVVLAVKVRPAAPCTCCVPLPYDTRIASIQPPDMTEMLVIAAGALGPCKSSKALAAL